MKRDWIVTLVVLAVAGAALAQNPVDVNGNATWNKSKGNLIHFNPDAAWSSYREFRFDGSTYAPVNPEHALNGRDERKVTTALDARIRDAFKDVAADRGPVLEIKPVITDVKRTNTIINLISFAAYQMPFSYGAASVRFQLIDATSGRQIGEITSMRSARPWNVYPWDCLENFKALGQSSIILKNDAKRLRKDLDRLAKAAATQRTPSQDGE